MVKVVTLFSSEVGVGKSKIGWYICEHLASLNKKVCFLDLDIFATLKTYSLATNPKMYLEQFLMDYRSVLLEDLFAISSENLNVITAKSFFSLDELNICHKMIKENQFNEYFKSRIISLIGAINRIDKFDYLVIDSPAGDSFDDIISIILETIYILDLKDDNFSLLFANSIRNFLNVIEFKINKKDWLSECPVVFNFNLLSKENLSSDCLPLIQAIQGVALWEYLSKDCANNFFRLTVKNLLKKMEGEEKIIQNYIPYSSMLGSGFINCKFDIPLNELEPDIRSAIENIVKRI